MSTPVDLEPKEQELRNDIEADVKKIRALLSSDDRSAISALLDHMGRQAHALHVSLTHRNLEPQHHKYMVRNRGMQPSNPSFYMHVHPVEDLLKFLDDTGANADPVDRSLGKEFDFSVYSRRWGHDDVYRIRRTETGWDVNHLGIGGPCNKRGEPFLYKNFAQDGINFPASLPDYLESLWVKASADGSGLSPEEVQRSLHALAEWVSTTERSTPGEFE